LEPTLNQKTTNRLPQIVQITAGASFSAALTEKGSVVAWGNLRVFFACSKSYFVYDSSSSPRFLKDTQGEVNVHETLKDIQKKPVVVIRHKSKEHWHIVKVTLFYLVLWYGVWYL
jgi:alpha-tubulin suppressor-like RCC1 family protein